MASLKPKVLGIAGSPRRNGNTELLLQQAVAGAISQGAEAKVIIISELNIAPCCHCDRCWETGRCVIEDDMQWVSSELRQADHLILVSPMAINPNSRRTGLFISVSGKNHPDLFHPAIATVKSWFIALGVTYAGDLLFPGVDKKGAIVNDLSIGRGFPCRSNASSGLRARI